jgi:hypothetical protein
MKKRSGGGAMVHIPKTTVDLIEGKTDPSTWTLEELIRGAPGNVRRPPNFIPLNVYQELMKRVLSKTRVRFAEEVDTIVEKHIEVIKRINPRRPTSSQMKAIDMVYNIVGVYEPHKIDVTLNGEAPWQKLVASSIVSVTEEDDVVDGEVVDDEEEEGDE